MARFKFKSACVGMALAATQLPAAQAAMCVNQYAVNLTLTLVNNNPGGQLTGQICTDGTIGAIVAANIASWDLSLTGENTVQFGSYHWSSANGGTVQFTNLSGSPALTASASALTWNAMTTTVGNYDLLQFRQFVTVDDGVNPAFVQEHFLAWYQHVNFQAIYYGWDNPDPPGGGQVSYNFLQGPGDRQQVPEPGSLALLLLAAAALVARSAKAQGAAGGQLPSLAA